MIIERRNIISIKVLIVDDEEIILEEASETLTEEGYECFAASGVKAAIKVIETTPGISLILTDLRMQGESGADLIKMVEEKFGQDIKFIVMSGHVSPSIEIDDINLELYPFLRKPLGINSLIEMVDTVLETKK
jgi:DNA-binding NtrC family response regulator